MLLRLFQQHKGGDTRHFIRRIKIVWQAAKISAVPRYFRGSPKQRKTFTSCLVSAADDDGLVDCVQAVKRSCGCNAIALRQLCDQGFVLMFADDLLVIRHWHAMNKIPPSKYKESRYQALLAQLKPNKNGYYEVVSKTSQ